MKKIIALLLALTLAAALSCSFAESGNLTKITFCLDWTPNTNHTGVYAAQALGYYREAGLDVEIVQPPENGALLMCAAGQAQFAVDAQDTMAASLDLEQPLGITSVAALIQHNTSGILSRAEDGITSAKGLENRVYATWDSPIELAMLRYCMEKEGADFSKLKLIPNNVTDEPAALAAHQIDAVWIFYGWSGVNAELSDVKCGYWDFASLSSDLDYYTPVILANNDFLIPVCHRASGGSRRHADRRGHHGVSAGFPGAGGCQPALARGQVYRRRSRLGYRRCGSLERLLFLAECQRSDKP